MGIKVEMEHTSDPDIAKEIALDHLTEDPEYYTHLAEMEEKYSKMRHNPAADLDEENIGIIFVMFNQYSRAVRIFAVDTSKLYKPGETLVGFLSAIRRDKETWQVGTSAADRDVGPRLYQMAMLYAHQQTRDGVLLSDLSVSDDAAAVWEKFIEAGWAERRPYEDDEESYIEFEGQWNGDKDLEYMLGRAVERGEYWASRQRKGTLQKLMDEADEFFRKKYAANSTDRNAVYSEWRELVNMSPRELERFLAEYGDVAGLSRAEASAQGIRSGRDSARAILRMKRKLKSEWTERDWTWAKRQIAFIKRMRGARGALYDSRGEPTRKLLALLVWGHNPEKS